MKKHIIFIIIVISILAFQSCIEGYFSFCEEVETKEERCEIGGSNCCKTSRQNIQIKGTHNYSFQASSLSFLRHCDVVSQIACLHNSSVILSELFNHSPPAITSFSV